MIATIENQLIELYKNWCGEVPVKITQLPHSGSNRIYFRMQGHTNLAIGVYNKDLKENIAFWEFTRQFQNNRINVPELYAQNLDQHIYLISDLGDVSLLEWMNTKRVNSGLSDEIIKMYKKVIRELVKIQIVAGRTFDYTHAISFKEFNKEAILYDLEYFKSKFTDALNIEYSEKQLGKDFDVFADYLLSADNNYFMFRDFQARNIMLFNNEPYFIDYQGGRKGALQYDLVSLLFQAKAQIPEEIKGKLLDYYIKIARLFLPINRDEFIRFYYAFALVRVLQTLGAYGLRGIIEKKSHFLESIPLAMHNLTYLIQKVEILNQLPELKLLIEKITNLDIKTHE